MRSTLFILVCWLLLAPITAQKAGLEGGRAWRPAAMVETGHVDRRSGCAERAAGCPCALGERRGDSVGSRLGHSVACKRGRLPPR